MNFKFGVHSLIVLCGPSGSGKSTLARFLAEQAKSNGLTSVVLSSDDIRRQLLGEKMDLMDPRMLEVSGPAFRLLEASVDSHLQYPTNTNMVIVDSTAMDGQFREFMRSKAESHGYESHLIVLGYTRLTEKDERHIMAKGHLLRIKKDVMPNLSRKSWTSALHVGKPTQLNKAIEEVVTNPSNAFDRLDLYKACQLTLPQGQPLWAVGDIHESHEALSQLVEKLPAHGQGVLIGDIVDCKLRTDNREQRLEATLSLVESLLQKGVRLVRGNHEQYCARRLRGEIEEVEVEKTAFNAMEILLKREDLAQRFLAIYDQAVPFIKAQVQSGVGYRTVYLTHSPCEHKVIGKLSDEAIKAQVNHRFRARGDEDAMREELAFVKAQSDRLALPHHVFGHVAVEGKEPFTMKTTHWLDTGAAHGQALSAVIFDQKGYEYASVKTEEIYGNKEPVLQVIKPKSLSPSLESVCEQYYELEDEDQFMVQKVLNGRAQFVSGTMAPAPASGRDLESLDKAIAVFAEGDVEKVIAQPKYMGSRCQAYLNMENPEQSFFVSRNGLEIRPTEELTQLAKDLVREHWEFFSSAKQVVLDGELMPWAALGKGLIEKDFQAYGLCVQEHLDFLSGDDQFSQFKVGLGFDVDEHQRMLDVFNKQLELYGQEGPLEFKAFNVLKVDDEYWGNKDQELNFSAISNDDYVVADPRTEEGQKTIRAFFESCTTGKSMEGIVLKPVMPAKETVPPYVKVRNKEYLTLIYGYDYPTRLDKLCATKFVRGKARLATIEHKLGELMLTNPEHRSKLVYAMFGSIAKERSLDPRL